jgi:hypothetical protein
MPATKSVLPEIDLARIRRLADGRVPARLRHQIRVEIEVSCCAVTVVDCRAPWTPEIGPERTRFPIARLKFSPTASAWTLFWRDRNSAWHRYQQMGATPFVDPLLAEIAADPTSIFCG